MNKKIITVLALEACALALEASLLVSSLPFFQGTTNVKTAYTPPEIAYVENCSATVEQIVTESEDSAITKIGDWALYACENGYVTKASFLPIGGPGNYFYDLVQQNDSESIPRKGDSTDVRVVDGWLVSPPYPLRAMPEFYKVNSHLLNLKGCDATIIEPLFRTRGSLRKQIGVLAEYACPTGYVAKGAFLFPDAGNVFTTTGYYEPPEEGQHYWFGVYVKESPNREPEIPGRDGELVGPPFTGIMPKNITLPPNMSRNYALGQIPNKYKD